jgi:transcription termination/antitermination protein NusA
VRVKLNKETLGLSSFFERKTGALVKDCFLEQDTVFFVVSAGNLGRALGKGGSMIRKVQEQLKKKIRIIEYSPSASAFVKNIIYPVKVQAIVEGDGQILIKDEDRKKKGQIIGRSGSNLEFINKVVGRFFDMEVKVE